MKIDMTEVQEQKTALSTSQTSLSNQIETAKSSFESLVNSESLKGDVKSAINAKISNHQIPLLTNFSNAMSVLSAQYDKTIEQFQTTVSETAADAIIDTDYLQSILDDFSSIETSISTVDKATANIYNSISDIISLTNPDASTITTPLSEGKTILTDTKTNMESFNGWERGDEYSTLLQSQTQTLESLSNAGQLSFTNEEARAFYNSKDFLDAVKEVSSKANNSTPIELLGMISKTINKDLGKWELGHKADSKEAAEFFGVSVEEWNEIVGKLKDGNDITSTSIIFLKGKMYLNGMEVIKNGQGFAVSIKDSEVIPEFIRNFKKYINKKGFQLEFVTRTGNYRALDKVVYNQGSGSKQVTAPGRTLEQALDMDLAGINYAFKPGGGINYKSIGNAAKAGFTESIKSVVTDFKPSTWKNASTFTRTGKFLGALGTAFTVVESVTNNIDISDGIQGRELRNAAIDATISIGAGAGATAAGAAIGSFFLPPLGTAVGALAGIGINTLINTNIGNTGKSAVQHVQSFAKGIGDSIANFFGGGK